MEKLGLRVYKVVTFIKTIVLWLESLYADGCTKSVRGGGKYVTSVFVRRMKRKTITIRICLFAREIIRKYVFVAVQM